MIFHKWISVEMTEEEKQEWTGKFICTRGDCKCEKFTFNLLGVTGSIYERNRMIYNKMPECWGDTPINEQNQLD